MQFFKHAQAIIETEAIIQYRYSKDADLLVLASAGYDADDYIRDYDAFLPRVKSAQ